MINTIKNKFFIIIFLLSIIVLLISGCSVEKETLKKDNEKIQIITTLFPQYDFAKKVGGDRVDVKLLIPPGVEAHSFEPTPRDMVSIEKADIFIYTNEYMEPWAVKIAENVKSDELIIIDASKDVELMDIDGYEEHDHHDDHDHGDKDPHIWTDPIYAKYMVNNIVDGLIKSDPENSEFYIKNGEDYKKELDALHKKIKTALEKTQSNKIIYGGHFAFGYFAKRYNLEYISPYVGFSPNAEP
ncbi:MAG: zinc ABC transporter solute-binding protein, partial [Clostridiales bacterium]|nr:zinc ABC transporter solute-binding protein [Clostridiales bacterium]